MIIFYFIILLIFLSKNYSIKIYSTDITEESCEENTISLASIGSDIFIKNANFDVKNNCYISKGITNANKLESDALNFDYNTKNKTFYFWLKPDIQSNVDFPIFSITSLDNSSFPLEIVQESTINQGTMMRFGIYYYEFSYYIQTPYININLQESNTTKVLLFGVEIKYEPFLDQFKTQISVTINGEKLNSATIYIRDELIFPRDSRIILFKDYNEASIVNKNIYEERAILYGFGFYNSTLSASDWSEIIANSLSPAISAYDYQVQMNENGFPINICTFNNLNNQKNIPFEFLPIISFNYFSILDHISFTYFRGSSIDSHPEVMYLKNPFSDDESNNFSAKLYFLNGTIIDSSFDNLITIPYNDTLKAFPLKIRPPNKTYTLSRSSKSSLEASLKITNCTSEPKDKDLILEEVDFYTTKNYFGVLKYSLDKILYSNIKINILEYYGNQIPQTNLNSLSRTLTKFEINYSDYDTIEAIYFPSVPLFSSIFVVVEESNYEIYDNTVNKFQSINYDFSREVISSTDLCNKDKLQMYISDNLVLKRINKNDLTLFQNETLSIYFYYCGNELPDFQSDSPYINIDSFDIATLNNFGFLSPSSLIFNINSSLISSSKVNYVEENSCIDFNIYSADLSDEKRDTKIVLHNFNYNGELYYNGNLLSLSQDSYYLFPDKFSLSKSNLELRYCPSLHYFDYPEKALNNTLVANSQNYLSYTTILSSTDYDSIQEFSQLEFLNSSFVFNTTIKVVNSNNPTIFKFTFPIPSPKLISLYNEINNSSFPFNTPSTLFSNISLFTNIDSEPTWVENEYIDSNFNYNGNINQIIGLNFGTNNKKNAKYSIINLEGFELVDVDKGVDFVLVEIYTKFRAKISLNSKYIHLADFNSYLLCAEYDFESSIINNDSFIFYDDSRVLTFKVKESNPSRKLKGENCIGDGFLDFRLKFVTTPDSLVKLLNGMSYIHTGIKSNLNLDVSKTVIFRDEIYVNIYDGVSLKSDNNLFDSDTPSFSKCIPIENLNSKSIHFSKNNSNLVLNCYHSSITIPVDLVGIPNPTQHSNLANIHLSLSSSSVKYPFFILIIIIISLVIHINFCHFTKEKQIKYDLKYNKKNNNKSIESNEGEQECNVSEIDSLESNVDKSLNDFSEEEMKKEYYLKTFLNKKFSELLLLAKENQDLTIQDLIDKDFELDIERLLDKNENIDNNEDLCQI